MGIRIDETDERIVYHLAREARHTSAPDIAEELDVSAPTVRNRIRRLEDEGVLAGYHAHVDYERLGGRLTNLFVCSTSATDRDRYARRILEVSGVVNVREAMAGRGDLRVKAVGTDTDDLTRIAQEITALGVEIEDEDLLHREYFSPYAPFGPETERAGSPVSGIVDLAGEANVIELEVVADAPIAGRSLREADAEGFLEGDVLVITIERDDRSITPKGDTTIRAGDFVTLLSRTGLADDTLRPFTGESVA